jgi:hypothetical protein
MTAFSRSTSTCATCGRTCANRGHARRNPQASTRKLEARTRKPRARTRKPQAHTRKPQAHTRKPQVLMQEPQARTRNPRSFLQESGVTHAGTGSDTRTNRTHSCRNRGRARASLGRACSRRMLLRGNRRHVRGSRTLARGVNGHPISPPVGQLIIPPSGMVIRRMRRSVVASSLPWALSLSSSRGCGRCGKRRRVHVGVFQVLWEGAASSRLSIGRQLP